MSLTNYLKEKGILKTEGHCQQVNDEVNILKTLASEDNIKNIFEIGFNAGHSAEIFLSSNDECKVVSVDIGNHDYIKMGKEFIDMKYPNRHNLIISNSLNVFEELDINQKYDLIFIDGCHHYDIAIKDLNNCRKIAHQNTIVAMDDTVFVDALMLHFNEGPTKAWNECIENGIIEEKGKRNFRRGRGIAWGKYIF